MVIVPVSSVLSSQLLRHGLAPLQSKVWVLRRLSSLVSVAHHQMLAMPLLLVASRVIVNVSPWLMLLSDSLSVRPGCVSLGAAETAVAVWARGPPARARGGSSTPARRF